MKKQFITTMATVLGVFAFGQVGVNTNTPQSTLDVVGTTTATKADGVLIPRFTVTELAAKDAAYGASQNGVLVFVTSGVGSAGKTSDITGTNFYYYDSPTSKWKVAGGGGSASVNFNVTDEKTDNYTVLPADNFIKLNINTTDKTLTLPTSGISVGKTIYVSNIGLQNVEISPSPRNDAYKQVQAKASGILVYLGGTGDGSWDWVTGF
ncbi:hypothetical protein D1631_13430 [Chryseobacterium nematophagum]|uniref:T9SS C-terminal target domain-containing protein n=1 Tax=Chryseobacterium nematophagum TaxID=2305228 RepID=A0A3M7TH03_9FLAO|nr:hypothetical protein [Chryseobacterium nematophagum]RNA62862.1 hypothetical protein D1631_13430 [Chryseobacterium nematophagum]